MPRVYVRKFDWDEAARRYAAGESQAAIARDLGVTQTAIHYAVDRQSYAMALNLSAAWRRAGRCSVCGAPCSRLSGRTPRCRDCAATARRTTVRDDALKCMTCGEWKWDTGFPWNRVKRCEGRRGRHTTCRACHTLLKRDYRERRRIPCVRCGNPCLPASEKGPRGKDTGLCLTCYREVGLPKQHERLRKQAAA